MGCETCAKCLLVFINAIFLLIGLVMFAVGLTVHLSADFSQKAFSVLVEQLNKAAEQAGKTVDTENFNISEVLGSVTIVLIALGLFIAIIALMGIFGATCCFKGVIIAYFVVTLILFLAQLVMLLIFVIDRSVYDDAVKPVLKDSIQDEFAGFEGEDAVSLIWNAIMVELKCCGVDGYVDFMGAPKWKEGEHNTGGTYKAPRACCKTIDTNDACAENPDESISNWKTGCYDELNDYLKSTTYVIAATAGVLAFQLIILILTIIVIKNMATVDPMA